MRDDRILLEDILERISLTTEFVKDGHEVFSRTRMAQEGVIRNLEIIGEACRLLSPTIRDANDEVPWSQIIAFRNFATHVYWDIRVERVWTIVTEDLPRLR